MGLRDRCREMIAKMQRDAIMRQGSPVDDLMAFVMSEKGRSADERLEDTKPLILYFGTEQDREEFMEIMKAAKPGMRVKPIPG